MARRIVVVLSQSPIASSNRTAFEEELATLLIMESGIDINVIPHAEHLEPGSTGLLCLEGIVGDMVFASWMETEEAESTLRQLGVVGRRGKSAFDGNAGETTSGTSGRRIYFLNLADQQDPLPLMNEIGRIREDAQVQTFDILGVLPKRKIVQPGAQTPQPPPLSQSPQLTSPQVDKDSDDDAMDRLVDELDAMDL